MARRAETAMLRVMILRRIHRATLSAAENQALSLLVAASDSPIDRRAALTDSPEASWEA
jgi:hypothetical protein